MLELPRNDERETFPAGFVDDRQDAELAAVMRAPLDEVVSPDVPGYSGRRRMHDPSLSQRRPRFGWRSGTLRTSRRQIRSTRLWFTVHPAWHSKAVTRR